MENRFDFENFIANEPPYKTFKLSVEDVKKISHLNDIRVELFCKNCGKPQTFVHYCEQPIMRNIDGCFKYQMMRLTAEQALHYTQEPPERPLNYVLSFSCAKCNLEYFYIIHTDRETIKKIGQNPSFGELQGNEINKYKSLLPKYFIEFKSALNCYSQGKGIAAFVYLRRILEDLVEKAFDSLQIKKTGDEKFLDKLKSVQREQEIIPPDLEEIKNAIYQILSKGVHEYEEQECLELFEYVKFVIIEILDKQLIQKERNEKIKNVKGKLLKKSKES